MDLGGRWQFRRLGKGTWLSAKVPGCVHTDLLAHKLIPDPFWGENELKLEWIEQADWEYRRSFTVSRTMLRSPRVDLVAEGLDTVATVRVNGHPVLRTDNMFTGYRVNIRRHLKAGRNSIHVVFGNPIEYIRKRRRLVDSPQWNDPVGGCCVIRKEQCSFGWDWGPRLPTSGIYMPIRLEAYPVARIESVEVRQRHGLNRVRVMCRPTLHGRMPKRAAWRTHLALDGKVVARADGLNITVDNPRLWWPNGLGEQPLYELTVELLHEGEVADTWRRRIGLRTILLDRHADQWGQSFQFRVNGVPFFAKGANWIPAHSFQSRVDRALYDDLLSSAAQANMNMLRVWGGGVYEKNDFYELCDEKGLLVWHDFMFACSLYPGTETFLRSVRREAEYQVRRLGHHPCMALWCGNNELEGMRRQLLSSRRIKRNYDTLFYELLPDVVKRLAPQLPYWPSSPHNPAGYVRAYQTQKGGDAHDWGVWHGKNRAVEVQNRSFRFVSEYGMQSYPSVATARTFADSRSQNVFGAVMENHQKSARGNSLVFEYISHRYRFPRDHASLVYLSQANQAYAVQTAIEHHRRSMPRTMGSLYWQINDCWPVASWASVEFGGRWKALHYAARRAFAPVLVSARILGEETVGRINRQVNTVTGCEISTVCDAPRPVHAVLRWTLYHLDGRKLLQGSRRVVCRYNESVVRTTLELQRPFARHGKQSLYLHVYIAGHGRVLSQNTVFFTAPRFMELPSEKLNPLIKRIGEDRFRLTFRAKTYQHMVAVDVRGMTCRMSDNWFDLYPRIPCTVELQTPRACTIVQLRRRLSVRSLSGSY
jgi:beta-mannosidase